MSKYECNLDALALKLLSSKQRVIIYINKVDYTFYYSTAGNSVQLWVDGQFVYSHRIVASVVMPRHIKESLERGIYILDYPDLKSAYGVTSEPACLANDAIYQDVKHGRFLK